MHLLALDTLLTRGDVVSSVCTVEVFFVFMMHVVWMYVGLHGLSVPPFCRAFDINLEFFAAIFFGTNLASFPETP